MIHKYFRRGFSEEGFYYEAVVITLFGIKIFTNEVVDELAKNDKSEEDNTIGFIEPKSESDEQETN